MRSYLFCFRGPLLVFAGVAAVIVVAIVNDNERAGNAPRRSDQPPAWKSPTTTFPGLREPPTVSVAAAKLKDDEAVIGVVAHGKSRAYAIKAMSKGPRSHVINDLVAGTPITVTYCDLRYCVRVFTDAGSSALNVDVGGFRDGAMMLKVGTQLFSQETGQSLEPENIGLLPLAAADFERTTWKEWRNSHPETDVYAGDSDSETSGRPTSGYRQNR